MLAGVEVGIAYRFAQLQSTQASLASHLSSGLRVESAADDPSGLAISETIRTKVAGLQQSVENVQTGTNALTVADGVLANITHMLVRVRSLIVEAASDVNSNEQLSAIQIEISQMLFEINRMAANANFNGLKLFDGSHDTYVAPQNNFPTVQEVNIGLLPDGSAPTGDTVYDATNSGTYNPQKLLQNVREGAVQQVEGFLTFEITGYSTNPVDPNLGPLGQPGVYIENDMYSTDPRFAGNVGQEEDSVNAEPTNTGPNFASGGSISFSTPGNWIGIFTNIMADVPNISQQDVGAAIGFVISNPRQSGGGTAITVNDGGNEGNVVSISLPTVSTLALDIANISVLRPTLVDQFDNPIGTKSSNDYAVIDAETRVDNAIAFISDTRAQVGAQVVSLGEDSNSGQTLIANLTQSDSSIRDLSIGDATVAFTKNQVLEQIDKVVLAQARVDDRAVISLVASA